MSANTADLFVIIVSAVLEMSCHLAAWRRTKARGVWGALEAWGAQGAQESSQTLEHLVVAACCKF